MLVEKIQKVQDQLYDPANVSFDSPSFDRRENGLGDVPVDENALVSLHAHSALPGDV